MQNYFQNHRLFFYLLLVFFSLFIGTSVFVTFNTFSKKSTEDDKKQLQNFVEPEISSPTSNTEGSLSLTMTKNKILSTDSQVVIDIIADSNGKNITGYDLVFSYDPIAFDFIKATSSLAYFKVYSYNRGDYLSLLVTKELQSKEVSIFSQTKIISIVFKPNKKGKYDFSLKSLKNKDKTDLVTDKTEILNPSLNNLKIEVF